MSRTSADLDSVWCFCTRHRALLERSAAAGCFHCVSIFTPSEISAWIGEAPRGGGAVDDPTGVTALCPRCGMDTVLPSAAVSLTPELLAQMADHFFGGRFEPGHGGR